MKKLFLFILCASMLMAQPVLCMEKRTLEQDKSPRKKIKLHRKKLPLDCELLKATVNNDIKKVKDLLNKGANRGVFIDDENLHEHIADESFQETICAITDGDENYFTYAFCPLAIAAYKNHQELFTLLLEETPDQELRNEALAGAFYGNAIGCMKTLIKTGAEVNFLFIDRYPLITMIHSKTSRKSVQLLIENGADINTHNDSSDTPLHIAVLCSNYPVIELLIKSGALVNKMNTEAEHEPTPLLYALENDNTNTALFLIKCCVPQPYHSDAYKKLKILVLGIKKPDRNNPSPFNTISMDILYNILFYCPDFICTKKCLQKSIQVHTQQNNYLVDNNDTTHAARLFSREIETLSADMADFKLSTNDEQPLKTFCQHLFNYPHSNDTIQENSQLTQPFYDTNNITDCPKKKLLDELLNWNNRKSSCRKLLMMKVLDDSGSHS